MLGTVQCFGMHGVPINHQKTRMQPTPETSYLADTGLLQAAGSVGSISDMGCHLFFECVEVRGYFNRKRHPHAFTKGGGGLLRLKSLFLHLRGHWFIT
jgi:hypothetical protein